MNLDMLYATYGDRVYKLIEHLPEQHENTRILIVHQITEGDDYSDVSNKLSVRPDIKYITSFEKGVTKSRNLAIAMASSDIVFFCDDDVIYKLGIQSDIISAHEKYIDAGFITFAYTESELESEPHRFKKSMYEHSFFSILSVGTIQVSCKRKTIVSNEIYFPEDMGAGNKIFLCDEPVFLSGFIKKGIKGIYLPISIGFHPEDSSGLVFNDYYAFLSRLFCFVRIFGNIKGRFLYVVFLMKNYSKFNGLLYTKIALSLVFKKV